MEGGGGEEKEREKKKRWWIKKKIIIKVGRQNILFNDISNKVTKIAIEMKYILLNSRDITLKPFFIDSKINDFFRTKCCLQLS